MLNKLRLRLRALFFKSKLEDELQAELQFHIEREIEENIARGMTSEDARYAALRSFGGVERVKEESRDVRGGQWLETIWQDLRYGVRMLVKSPGFTLIAVMTLALGIGANTAIFSVVDTVLLKTLPVENPERLVLFSWKSSDQFRFSGIRFTSNLQMKPGSFELPIFRHEVFEKMRERYQLSKDSPLADLFAFGPLPELTVTTDDHDEIAISQGVSGSYFSGLGVKPILGHLISFEDDKTGATPVVVLSYRYWSDHFGARQDVIGKTLKLNKQPFTIIGVTPAAFTGSLQVNEHPDFSIPIACEPLVLGDHTLLGTKNNPGVWWLYLMGRLKPGATFDQARENLDGAFLAIAMELMPPPFEANQPAKLVPKDYPHLFAESGSRGMLDARRWYSVTIYGLFIVVAIVLLIACANVANLLLAKAASRNEEISIRLAVGAKRWQIIQQLLTESVMLALLGGGLGVLIAFLGKNIILALTSKHGGILPHNIEISISWRVLGFTIIVSMLTGILFGLAPAWRATKQDLSMSFMQGRSVSGTISRLSKSLIIAQVMLSLLLLIEAGLFLRTLNNLQQVNLGFNQENLLTFRLQTQNSRYKGEQLLPFFQQLFSRLDHLPGAKIATFANLPLMSNASSYTEIVLLNGNVTHSAHNGASTQIIRENYFKAMEIPLLNGRSFNEHDTMQAPPVAIVNQSFANRYFPKENIIGKQIRPSGNLHYIIEIIGVVKDSKFGNHRDSNIPMIYSTWQQQYSNIDDLSFAIRTEGDPATLTRSVRQTVRQLDDNLIARDFIMQKEQSSDTLGSDRITSYLFSFFGGLALFLTVIGISGTLAYSVMQRTYEIGIRMALGAQTSSVMRTVIWQGMKLTLCGLFAGGSIWFLFIRLFSTRASNNDEWNPLIQNNNTGFLHLFTNQFYGVKGFDPLTIAIVVLLIIVVAIIACWFPARRATKVDPLVALRCE